MVFLLHFRDKNQNKINKKLIQKESWKIASFLGDPGCAPGPHDPPPDGPERKAGKGLDTHGARVSSNSSINHCILQVRRHMAENRVHHHD